MSFGSKKKEPRYAFSFSLESPSKQTPSKFPYRAPIERTACLHSLFYIPLKFLIKIYLNKENVPSLKGPRKGVFLHVPQKWGPYGNTGPFPEP